MTDQTPPSRPHTPADLPPIALAELTGTAWKELPHFRTGQHNVPDTPDILLRILDTDRLRRIRAVEDLYRLLLNQDSVCPATAPAALIVAALLEDSRTLTEDKWDRRPGRRPLRAELLNWLASFADVARRPAEEGVGAAQDLAAARAVRPTLHARIVGFCQDDDPQVKEAAVAAVALLLADPVLAPSVPHHAPAVWSVLAESANSYYRWIARDRLTAWGEDVAVPLTTEEDDRNARSEASAVAENPFDEGQIQAIHWLAAQSKDTAAAEPPSRWHPDWAAPVTTTPDEPVPEQPTTAQGHEPGYRGPWRIARDEERAEWTFTPYIGVGPLHFGMTLDELTTALDETPTRSSWYTQDDGTQKINFADFTTTGIRALFQNGHLACLAVDALTGPQSGWTAPHSPAALRRGWRTGSSIARRTAV
ncbi:hypothetical protein ACFWP2_29020 [Kitasatospora sp. NPDC058444]|uniref:hypothetical protein n=1 Tax=Kitasatospora sp. NPDC058444 TaxID=3346504 RepID=UPI00364DDB27